jgi:arylsulfatase A-like enzyme
MKDEIRFADASIGNMVEELKDKSLLDSTLIIITAKHGQSPIDNKRFNPIPGPSGTNGASPANVLVNFDPNFLPFSESPLNPTGIGPTEDDISQLWLASGKSLATAVAQLESHASTAGIGQIFYGPSLETMFNAPGLPPSGDPRTPDIIVQPNVGVVYTGSSKKQAEHGGFAQDDTNVILLVSNTSFQSSTVSSFVETSQVAPTILQALGLDPSQLQGVKKEGTPVLPGLNLGTQNQGQGNQGQDQ